MTDLLNFVKFVSKLKKSVISQAFLYRFGSKLVCDQGLGMRWLMPNDSQIEAWRANILAGEGDVHDLNFTFIVLYKLLVGGKNRNCKTKNRLIEITF